MGGAAPAIAFNRMNAHYAIGFNVEPGAVVEEAKDKAGDAVNWAKDKAGDVKDWAKDKVDDLKGLSPFDGDGPPLLPPRVPLFPGPISLPGPISMRRLDEAFARLQSLL